MVTQNDGMSEMAGRTSARQAYAVTRGAAQVGQTLWLRGLALQLQYS